MIQSNTVGKPTGATINTAYTAASATTTAVSSTTNTIRCYSTTDCFIEMSVVGTAATTTTSLPLAGGIAEYFSCDPSTKVSADSF